MVLGFELNIRHPFVRSLLDESMQQLEGRADEILGKLGKMDRMLEALVKGDTDCPRLFILTPAKDSPAVRTFVR